MKRRNRIAPPLRRRRPAGGFTLIELLVAVSLSIVLVLIMSITFEQASETQRAARDNEEILRNATTFFRSVSELLANCDTLLVDKDYQDAIDAGDPVPVFAIEQVLDGLARDDAMMFTTRAIRGFPIEIDPDTGEIIENEDAGISFAPQTVLLYVRPSSHPSLRELVVERLGRISLDEIPQSIDQHKKDNATDLAINTSEISVVCRFVTEFKVEYLEIEAQGNTPSSEPKSIPSDDLVEGRSYLEPGDEGLVSWHDPNKRNLHDIYDRSELTLPRALRFTIVLQARKSDAQREFQVIVPVRSAHVVETAAP